MPPRFFGDDDSGWSAPVQPPTRRVALVVGNGNYRSSRLENPARDARLIGDMLDQLGFDTELVIDAGKAILETAIVRLGERLEKAGPEAVGFFYFAGHGIQHQGSNYLVPIDAQIPDTRYLKSGAVMVDYLVEELARSHALANVVVLDACRDSAVRDSGGGMTQGLASIKDLPDGTLVVFSTAAGQVADDGYGDHSPYARALVRHLAEPNRRLEEIFFSVSRDVAQATGNAQRPALFVQGAIAPVVLRPVEEPPPPPVAEPAAPPVPDPAPEPPVRSEPAVLAPATPPAPEPVAVAPVVPAAPPPELARTLAPVAEPPADWGPLPVPDAMPALPAAPADMARPQAFVGPGTLAPAKARQNTSQWAALAVVVVGVVAIVGGVASLFLRQQPVTVDLANPVSWPVAKDTAVLWRVPQGEPCGGGWSRVLDGLYCIRSTEPLGAIWDTGRLATPQATAMTLKVSSRAGSRCGDSAVFESDTACLEPIRPEWLTDPLRQSSGMTMDIGGALAGTADLLPRASAGCSTPSVQFPFSGYCLTGAGRFGIVTPTMLGHERLAGASQTATVNLTAYQKLTTCPRLTTVLENEQYCLVGTIW